MGNTVVNLILCSIVSIVITALALLAISEPISRMRAYKRPFDARRFRATQEKSSRIVGGKK